MVSTPTRSLYVALELGWDKWHLACATQPAEKPRFRPIPARDLNRLQQEIAKAKARFGLPDDAPVFTCYEAGRDGFWVHRALTHLGIHNRVVDSSSIEVNRRSKRVKSDPVDAAKLLNLLCRYHAGENKVWSVVNVPGVADEDRRQLHRGLKDLQRQQTECSNRIKGLLASQGLDVAVDAHFRTTLAALRDWSGQPVPAGLQQRILQEFAVWEVLHRQVRDAATCAVVAWVAEATLLLADLGWVSRAVKLGGVSLVATAVCWLAAVLCGLIAAVGWRSKTGLLAVAVSLLLPVGFFCLVLCVGSGWLD